MGSELKTNKILKEFDKNKSNYNSCEKVIRTLLYGILDKKSINIHKIETRVKKRESLRDKIESKDGIYKGISEITDVIGTRIITLFDEDISKIEEIIRKEFKVDEYNSENKTLSNTNEFGYQSVHFVVQIGDKRSGLPEYSMFKDLKFEIQIRTVLQHARAEIEHDLGYKNNQAIPQKERRSFLRISALLETADNEFKQLRKSLKKYERSLPKKMKNDSNVIGINKLSLKIFMENDKTHKEFEKMLLRKIGAEYNPNIKNEMNYRINTYVTKLDSLGIKTITELKDKINTNKKLIETSITKNLRSYKSDGSKFHVAYGINIFYLIRLGKEGKLK